MVKGFDAEIKKRNGTKIEEIKLEGLFQKHTRMFDVDGSIVEDPL